MALFLTVLSLVLRTDCFAAGNSEITIPTNVTSSNFTLEPSPPILGPPPHPHPPHPPHSGEGNSDTVDSYGGSYFESKLYATDGSSYAKFGHRLASSGRMMVVGQNQQSSTTRSVYLYRQSAEQEGDSEHSNEYDDEDSAFHAGTSQWSVASVTASSTGTIALSDVTASVTDDGGEPSSIYDGFGLAVSIDHDVFAVGAPFDSTTSYYGGRVYVFYTHEMESETDDKATNSVQTRRSTDSVASTQASSYMPDGEWGLNYVKNQDSPGQTGASLLAVLTPHDGLDSTPNPMAKSYSSSSEEEIGTQFGAAVALLNETLVVGAPGFSKASSPQCGAAYVFGNGSESQWTMEKILTNNESNPMAYAHFGSVLSVHFNARANEDVLAVSAVGYSESAIDAGAVYIYARSRSEVSVATESSHNSSFSSHNSTNKSASLSTTDEASSDVDSDADTSPEWVLQSVLSPETLTARSRFGYTLAFKEDVGLVSAYTEDGRCVYVFRRMSGFRALSNAPGNGSVEADSGNAASLIDRYENQENRSISDQSITVWVMVSILNPASSSDSLDGSVPDYSNFGASLAIFVNSSIASAANSDDERDCVYYSAYDVYLCTGSSEAESRYVKSEMYVAIVGSPGSSEGESGGSVHLFSSPSSAETTTDGQSDKATTQNRVQSRSSAVHMRGTNQHDNSNLESSSIAATNNAELSETWNLIGRIFANKSTSSNDFDSYGCSVAVMGSHILVGAELANTPIASYAGAVYLEANAIQYYLTAAEEEDDPDSGKEYKTESNGSNRSVWQSLSEFFSSSSGIVTMSFVPFGLVLIVFYAVLRYKYYPNVKGLPPCLPLDHSKYERTTNAQPGKDDDITTHNGDRNQADTTSPNENDASKSISECASSDGNHSGTDSWYVLMRWAFNPMGSYRSLEQKTSTAESFESGCDTHRDERLSRANSIDGVGNSIIAEHYSIRSPVTYVPHSTEEFPYPATIENGQDGINEQESVSVQKMKQKVNQLVQKRLVAVPEPGKVILSNTSDQSASNPHRRSASRKQKVSPTKETISI